MLTAISSIGIVGIATKSINELAQKELEYQTKYASCIREKINPNLCKIKETPSIAKAVAGVSLLILAMSLFLYAKSSGEK